MRLFADSDPARRERGAESGTSSQLGQALADGEVDSVELAQLGSTLDDLAERVASMRAEVEEQRRVALRVS